MPHRYHKGLLPILLSISLLSANKVYNGFTSTTITGGNVFPGKWNNTNTGATLIFPKPGSSAATKYLVKIIFASDADSVLYPDPNTNPTHNWQNANNIGTTNEISVSGADGMAGNSAVSGDIETANSSLWSDGESFEFVILTYHGFNTIDDTIYSGMRYKIHETDGPHNRSTSWSISLTSDTDSGNSSTDETTNIANVKFDISGSFLIGDSVYIWADYTPAEGWSAWRDDVYYESNPFTTSVSSKVLGPVTTPLAMNSSDGQYRFYMTVIDSNGAQDYQYPIVNVYFDNQPPVAPNTPTLTSGSDTGFSSSDKLTKDNTPTFNVTSAVNDNPNPYVYDDNSIVLILVDGVVTDSTTDVDENPISENVTISSGNALADGTHQIRAKVRDRFGNLSNASGTALTIEVDTDGPSPPNQPQLISLDDSGWSNSDDTTAVNTPRCEVTGITSGDSAFLLFGSDTVDRDISSGGTLTLQPMSAQSDGAYEVRVTAMDPAGNSADALSNKLDIVIDATGSNAPDAPDLISGYDTGTSDTDNITKDTTLAFSLTGLTSGDSVYLKFNSNIVTRTLAQANSISNLSVTVSPTDYQGSVSVFAVLKDRAGNFSTNGGTLNITIDTQGPSAPTGIDLADSTDTGSESNDNVTSNSKPSFLITGVSSGDSVLLKFNDNIVGAGTASGSTITLKPSEQLDGTYTVKAVVIDIAGNESDPVTLSNVVIDTQGPVAPTTPDLLAASDKGFSDSDNITSDSTVTFRITGVEAGDSVYLQFDGATVARGKVGTGETSINLQVTDIDEGTYDVTAQRRDLAGNIGTVSGVLSSEKFTVDTTPPSKPSAPALTTGSDTGISSADQLTANKTPTFTINNLNGTTQDSVYLYFGSNSVARGLITSGTSFNLTAASQSDGTYQVKAKAFDKAGNQSELSDPTTIRIDTQKPNAPSKPTLLPSSDSGFLANYTNVNQPALIIAGLSTTRDSVRISFSGAMTAVIAAVVSQGTKDTLTLQSSTLTDGDYTVTAVAIDSAGNASNTSTALSITIDTNDPDPPTALDLKTTSDSGPMGDDDTTKVTTPTFTVSGGGITSGDSVFIVISQGSEKDTVGRGKTSGTSIDITIDEITTPYTDGNIIIQSYVMDPAGNTSLLSNSNLLTIILDTTPPAAPSVTLNSASESGMSLSDRLTNDRTPTFLISGIESTRDSVYLVVGTDTVARAKATVLTNFPITSTSLSDNLLGYSIKALTRDYAGNLSTASSTITVRIDSTKPTTPGLPNLLDPYDTGFLNNDNVTNHDTLALRISGLTNSDSLSLLVDGVITPFVGVYGNPANAAIVSGGKVDLKYVPTAGSKTFQFTVTVTDSAGNTSDASSTLTINRDQTAPTAPGTPNLADASDTGSDNGDNLTNDTTPEFAITGTTTGDSIYLRLGSQRVIGGLATGSSISLTTAALDTSGTLVFSAIAIDSAGNISEVSGNLTITLDTTAPDVSSVSIDLQSTSDTGISSSDNLTKDTTPTFTINNLSGTDSNPDSLYLVIGTDTTAQGGITSDVVTLTSDALTHSPTPYSVKVSVKDKAGNLSNASSSVNLRIDTMPPSEPNPPDLQTEYDFGLSDTDNITNSVDSSGWLAFILTGLSNTSRDSVVLFADNSVQQKMVISQVLRDTLRTPGIPTGRYDFTLIAIDSAGNISDTSSALTVVVDNNPPTTPTLPTMTVATDHGASSGDSQTNEPQPSFSTTNAESGSIMRLFSINATGDTTQLVVDTVGAGLNTITLTPETPFADGTYNIYIVSEDTAGNTVTSDVNYGIIIDTELPLADIYLTPDSLAKEGDVTRIWADFNEQVYSPEIYVAFAGGSIEDTTAMTQDDDTTWYYDLTNPAGNDGAATISLIGIDIAGNDITNGNTTGRTSLRLDNTAPVLTELAPDSGEYVNHTQVSYRISETVASGTITWAQVGGTTDLNAPHVQTLTASELQGNFSYTDITLTNNPNLVSGATYKLTWSVTDTAGNVSQSYIATPVHYDTTAPTGTLTYSHYHAAADTIVNITATFVEPMLPTPLISVDYTGIGNDITDQPMTMGTDSTVWTYAITIPSGQGVNGVVTVSISATDLALNTLPQVNLANRDTLIVDNTPPSVTFTYSNLSQPTLQFLEGKGGDTVQVAAVFSETMSLTPAPKLNIQYADSTTNSFTGMSEDSVTGNTWYYNVVLPTGAINSGIMTASITARDPAGNTVETINNARLFTVDNTPPATFNTGTVIPMGRNPVVGWLNGITDSVQVMVPIPSTSTDTTILFGGEVEIQMIDPRTMINWVTIGSNDSITVAGSSQPYYRPDSAITQALIPNLIEGDTILIRAALYDRVGNRTIGDTSTAILVYDPTPPALGAITGGNIFSQDTLISTDTITVAWSSFNEQTSGLQRYELAAEESGGDSINSFMDWTANDVTEAATLVLPLVHDSTYQIHIRAFDVAGNISDTLSSTIFRRINTAPQITTIDSSIALEDIPYRDTVNVVDPDLATLMGDEFRYYLTTTRIVGQPAVGAATIDSLTGIITWTPTQDDTGSYQLTVRVNDQWGFADTLAFPFIVLAVNDTPAVSIQPPDDNITFAEDHTDTVQISLTQYAHDVDNDSTTLTWAAVVLDTAAKPGFPTAYLFYGPGLPQVSKQTLEERFLPKPKRSGPKNLKKKREIARVRKTLKSTVFKSMITVTIDTLNGISTATFDADSDYYGANHRIIFFASDPAGAMSSDTILLTITPENDPPVWQPIALQEVTENDSLKIDFASYVYDVDDTLLTFKVAPLTNSAWIALRASSPNSVSLGDTVIYNSKNFGDTVVFIPAIEWSDSALIQVVALDEQNASDTTLFVLDVLRVPRPHLSIEVVQNNAFTNYFEVVVTDSAEKVDSISLQVQSQLIPLDTVANYTYVGHYEFSDPGNYNFVAYARGIVGDTIIFRNVFMTLAQANHRWWGSSPDGSFEIMGAPGAVLFDQPLLIADSTMFRARFKDRASYLVGNENMKFLEPVEVAIFGYDENLAIYQRKGIEWKELPSITEDGWILAYTDGMGYFRTGPKALIVPGRTTLHQNYPNPFNPVTNIVYDVGFMDGPKQKVNVSVFNLLGQQVITLVDEYKPIGRYTIRWDGRDYRGIPVATGMYFVRMLTDKGRMNTKKIMLLR